MDEERYFEGLDDREIAEQEKILRQKYRAVFASSEFGNEILGDILINFCHFGCALANPEEVAQYNVGIFILGRMGIFTKGNEINVIRGLLSTLKKEE